VERYCSLRSLAAPRKVLNPLTLVQMLQPGVFWFRPPGWELAASDGFASPGLLGAHALVETSRSRTDNSEGDAIFVDGVSDGHRATDVLARQGESVALAISRQ
jgi:hypothetical protein